MDSGPSTSSPPQGSGVAGSPNTSRFRISELLTSSPYERPRTSSLKGKQTRQDSFRSPRIYGPYYYTTSPRVAIPRSSNAYSNPQISMPRRLWIPSKVLLRNQLLGLNVHEQASSLRPKTL